MGKRPTLPSLLSLSLLLLLGAAPVTAEVPSVRDLEVDAPTLSDLVGPHQIVLQHPEEEYTINGEKKSIRYTTTMVLVDAPPDEARELVAGFNQYTDLFPNIHDVSVENSDNKVTFEETLRFAVIEPSVSYTLSYETTEAGDLLFERNGGDFQLYRGRWEFLPLEDGRTLLALTSRMDFSGIGWTADTILWAQPDLKRTLPVIRGTKFLDTFRNRLDGSGDTPADVTADTGPSIPTLLEDPPHPEALRKLAQDRLVIFIHPSTDVEVDGEVKDLTYLTTVSVVEGPLEGAREHLMKFEEVPNFINQLETVEAEEKDDGFEAKWYFDMGFGIFSVPVQYRTRYTWRTDRRLTYERISGDLKPIYGAYEWYEVSPESTLYGFTAGSRLGNQAPEIVKLGESLPRPQIFMGLSLGTVGVENGVRWANEQIQKAKN